MDPYRRYYGLNKDSLNLRESWLRDLAALKSKIIGGNQYGIYKSLITLDKNHRAGRCLRRVMGKVQTGLTHVEVNITTGKE